MLDKLKEKYLLFKVRTEQDPAAYAQIYDRYLEKIYRFIYFKVSSKETAEDLASETFLKLLEYLNSGKQVQYLGSLLYRIAKNLVIDHYRSREKEQKNIPIEDEGRLVYHLDTQNRLLKIAEVSADVELLYKSIKLLKEEYQEVVAMHYLDDIPVDEIAKILGKKSGTVRVTLHRALRSLQTLTEKQSHL